MKFSLKNKGKALIANLFYPGAGYFLLKKWYRGVAMLFVSVSSLVGLLLLFVQMIIGAYYEVQTDKEFSFNIVYLFLPLFIFLLLWIISFIDLILICTIAKKEKINKEASRRQGGVDRRNTTIRRVIKTTDGIENEDSIHNG